VAEEVPRRLAVAQRQHAVAVGLLQQARDERPAGGGIGEGGWELRSRRSQSTLARGQELGGGIGVLAGEGNDVWRAAHGRRLYPG
jgi:hypothetical protein